MSDSPKQSLKAVEPTMIDEQSQEEHLLWTTMLSGESSEYAQRSHATVCSALHLFCGAFERREAARKANEAAAAARRGSLPPAEPHNTALQPPHGHDAALHEVHAMGPTNDTSNDDKVVTADDHAITLDRFWKLLLERWKKHEETWDPATTFGEARRVLQRRKEMARAGIKDLDFLVEMLLSEYGAGHVHLFPTMLTPKQWYQLLADFDRDECKILFLLDCDFYRKAHLQAS
ncbi:hypothetical protein E4U12_008401 [Claviceps purpurea]|nr:hypothetical protein E4U12_008401 [Claviceps purpurea]